MEVFKEEEEEENVELIDLVFWCGWLWLGVGLSPNQGGLKVKPAFSETSISSQARLHKRSEKKCLVSQSTNVQMFRAFL